LNPEGKRNVSVPRAISPGHFQRLKLGRSSSQQLAQQGLEQQRDSALLSTPIV